MRHTRALQREADSRWDMATTGGGHTYAAGFCAGRMVTYGRPAIDDGDFHTGGHETKEEAEACYHRYLASRVRFGMFDDVQMKCKACGAWTQHHAQVEGTVWALCPQHHTAEHVLALVQTRGIERWQS